MYIIIANIKNPIISIYVSISIILKLFNQINKNSEKNHPIFYPIF